MMERAVPARQETTELTQPAAVDVARDGTPLSDRERECLQLIASGKTSWEIGEILGISHHTVNAHIRNIVRKLAVTSRPHAVAVGFRLGLIH
jgi:DNA-binding CsgD family transcriptional regulator